MSTQPIRAPSLTGFCKSIVPAGNDAQLGCDGKRLRAIPPAPNQHAAYGATPYKQKPGGPRRWPLSRSEGDGAPRGGIPADDLDSVEVERPSSMPAGTGPGPGRPTRLRSVLDPGNQSRGAHSPTESRVLLGRRTSSTIALAHGAVVVREACCVLGGTKFQPTFPGIRRAATKPAFMDAWVPPPNHGDYYSPFGVIICRSELFCRFS
jgi:hypothetical protein